MDPGDDVSEVERLRREVRLMMMMMMMMMSRGTFDEFVQHIKIIFTNYTKK